MKLLALFILCTCSSDISQQPIIINSDASYIDSSNDSHSPIYDDVKIVDANIIDIQHIGIPDAVAYDPVYTCVSSTQYMECDYGDAEPCDIKSCLMFYAPVCFNGHCYQ